MIKFIKKIVGAITPTKQKYSEPKIMHVRSEEVLELPSKTWYSKN